MKDVSFWAKTTPDGSPGISVYRHMINVGCVARALAMESPTLVKKLGLSPDQVGILAALHDLGKISPGFQQKCQAWLDLHQLQDICRNNQWSSEKECDHAKVSHHTVAKFLAENGLDPLTAAHLAAAVGAHHGKLKDMPSDRPQSPSVANSFADSRSGIDWDEERTKNANALLSYFGAQHLPDSNFDDRSPALWWLAGITTAADWIGSDERYFSPSGASNDENPRRIADIAVREIGLKNPEIKQHLSFNDLFPFPPNDLQKKAIRTIRAPGIYVVEAPMGMGKTEAALAAAYTLLSSGQARGIYFALPTQTTSNRIHLRMEDFIQKISLRGEGTQLIHGASWLQNAKPAILPTPTDMCSEVDDARVARQWFSSSKRALIAPFGVGTIDQALLGVVAAKHFFLRHYALAGKVVVLDEIHSYDIYTGSLITKLVQTLRDLNCTVILLSATLTGKRRDQLLEASPQSCDAYPLLTGQAEGRLIPPVEVHSGVTKKVSIQFSERNESIDDALSAANQGACVLWICNDVASAQDVYREITAKSTDSNLKIGLLHSRYPHWKREQLEQEWLARLSKESVYREGCILVSTQIVEQSVDLDADLVFSELAPTDMLLQRIGRLWRHSRSRRPIEQPEFRILSEAASTEDLRRMSPEEILSVLGAKAFVYDPYVLLRSLLVWNPRKEISIPGDIRDLIAATYDEAGLDYEPASWKELSDSRFINESNRKFKAKMNQNYWQIALSDEEGVQTRLNEVPTVSLVLAKSKTPGSLTLLDDSTVVIGSAEFQLSSAQSLHKNLVKVPKSRFDTMENSVSISRYIHGDQAVGIVNLDGRVLVEGLKPGISIRWSSGLGLEILGAKPKSSKERST